MPTTLSFDQILNIIGEVLDIVVPSLSAIGLLIISLYYNKQFEKLRIEWEKEKNHKDYFITIVQMRKNQIELFISNLSQALLEILGDIAGITLLKNQEQLDQYRNEVVLPLEQYSKTDAIILNYECRAAIRSLKNNKLNELLNEIGDLSFEYEDLYTKYLYSDSIKIDEILRDKELIKYEVNEIREKYENILERFYEELDATFLKYDPFVKK